MATELAKAYVQIIPSAKGIKAMLEKEMGGEAAAAGKSAGKSLGDGILSGLAGIGKAAAAALGAATAAVGAFASESVKTGMAFDSSMSKVAATMGLTVQDIANNVDGAADTFAMLREKALEMGSATNFTATQAAEGLNILAMSGYQASDAVGMIEDVLHLAAAGSMNMASAAGFVSGAMKGFADDTKDAEYYADLMAKGATLANTNVTQLGDALSGSAATAMSYGQSADTVTLALLRLAEQGEVGSAASTALGAAMKNLYAPTDQAKGILQELGVQAFDPATGSARDFNDVVNELESALFDYTDEQKTAYAQTIFGIQGFDAYNKMTVTSIETQNEWADALANASGEAARQYDTMTDNLVGDMDKLNSALDGVKIALSDELTPSLREGTQFLTDMAGKAQEFIENGGIEQMIDQFTRFSPLIAAATAAFLAYKGATAISGIMEALTKATESQTIAQAALNAIMNANPFVLVATLIATLVAALVTLYMTNEDFRNKVNAAWGSIKGVISGASNTIVRFFTQSIPNAAKPALDFLKSLTGQAIQWGQDMISGFADGIMSKARALLDSVKNIANNVRSFLHFSRPDTGPLRDYETWMPDFMQGLAQGIDSNAWRVEDAVSGLADMMRVDMDAAFSPHLTVSRVATSAEQRQSAGEEHIAINININGAQYSDENALAEAMFEKLQFLVDQRWAALGTA